MMIIRDLKNGERGTAVQWTNKGTMSLQEVKAWLQMVEEKYAQFDMEHEGARTNPVVVFDTDHILVESWFVEDEQVSVEQEKAKQRELIKAAKRAACVIETHPDTDTIRMSAELFTLLWERAGLDRVPGESIKRVIDPILAIAEAAGIKAGGSWALGKESK